MRLYAEVKSWIDVQLADALLVAPSVVTDSAIVYAWNEERETVLIRDWRAFNSVASGMLSIRMGKPAFPFQVPVCFDQNAWGFFQSYWIGQNPLKISRPYPRVLVVLWMLRGMSVADGMVRVDIEEKAEIAVSSSGKKIVQLPPQLIIMPLQMREDDSIFFGKYEANHPHANWAMFASIPLEQIMIHFSDVKTNRS